MDSNEKSRWIGLGLGLILGAALVFMMVSTYAVGDSLQVSPQTSAIAYDPDKEECEWGKPGCRWGPGLGDDEDAR